MELEVVVVVVVGTGGGKIAMTLPPNTRNICSTC